MAIWDDQFGGGSLGATSALPTAEITSGSSGTVLTIPATATQTIRITYLVSDAASNEGGMTGNFAGSPIFTAVTIPGATTTDLSVANRMKIGSSGNHNYIQGRKGEAFTLVKDTGSTGNNLYCSHQILES